MARWRGFAESPIRMAVAILVILMGLATTASWGLPGPVDAGQTASPALAITSPGSSPLAETSYWQYLPLVAVLLSDDPTVTPTPSPTPEWTIGNVVCNSIGAVQVCAWVSNPTPTRNQDLTVYGRLLDDGTPRPGLPLHTVWHYKSTTPTCDATTGPDGEGSCTRNIGAATTGYDVHVDVTISYNGQTYTVTTFFTPS